MTAPLFPKLSRTERMDLMTIPLHGKIPVVIDSDTFNEIDDQMAIAWGMLRPDRLDLLAIYAAPYTNHFFGENASHTFVDNPATGMQLSYEEIHRVFENLPQCKNPPPAFKGATRYLSEQSEPESTAATRDLITRARASSDTLQVIAIGAPTNVASALLQAPDIIHKIHVIWLGGKSYDWKDNQEFNLMQDLRASRVLFNSGVALTQIPCFGVVNCMASSVPEIQYYLANSSQIGNYFASIAPRCPWIGFASRKVIWDITTLGFVLNSDWFTTELRPSPLINDNLAWSFDNRRHLIQVVKFIERDELFKDMFYQLINADKDPI